MSSNLANETPAEASGADDYEAFCAVLAESARGRAFLAEHARRARQADTATLVAAFERLETRLAAQLAAAPAEPAPAAEAVGAGSISAQQATAIPEVMLFEPRPADPAPVAENVEAREATADAAVVEIAAAVVETVVVDIAAEPPRDPLAAVMALSEQERIALFT